MQLLLARYAANKDKQCLQYKQQSGKDKLTCPLYITGHWMQCLADNKMVHRPVSHNRTVVPNLFTV